jgi:hypothetical protein
VSALSELEMRIVSELEEAGEEDIVTMMNTVVQPAGDIRELADVQQALENLVRADLIRMSMDRDATGRLRDLSASESLDVIADLNSGLRFKGDKRLWTDTRQSGPPYGFPFPYIVNTASGKKKGFEILEERGYQWWRPKK